MSGWPALQCGQNETVKVAENVEVLPPPTPRKNKRIKLGDIRQIRAELSRVYRQARAGEIDTNTATRLTYILEVMGRMIERGELARRIENLEAERD